MADGLFTKPSKGVKSAMQGALIVTIVFGGIVLALAIIGSTILMAIKILRGGLSRKGQKFETEEARMIQEIYEGLSRMEERVEALETIILDSKGKDRAS
jgi:phage shock protein B